MTMGYHSKKALIERAKWLRKNQTRPERRLWSRLRRKQLEGWKFRRQHILEPFIVDFYCRGLRLVVEVDGAVHDQQGQREADASRDVRLREMHDVEVVRIRATDVRDNIEGVLEKIRDFGHAKAAETGTTE